MPFLSVQRYLGLAKEATRGTPVAADIFIPIDPNPTFEPTLTWLPDKELRGSAVEQYDDIPSVRHDDYSFKGNVFADTFPNLVLACLGGPDAVSGTVAPYTHKIGLANAPATGSQPPSYTVTDIDLITEGSSSAKQSAGGQLANLDIDFSADGALTYSSKYIGNPYTEVAAPATPAWSTEVFIPAWNGSVTFAGTQNATIISGSLSLQRSTSSIFTINGSQAPTVNFAGPLQVSGKLVILAEANDPNFANALSRDHQAVVLTFTDPVSSHSVVFQMSSCQLTDPKVDSSKAWEEITVNFVANANTTDAQNGGYAPVLVTASNAQSTTY